ncbi:hypothetical protein M878_43695 [Streptomyces roseochromogenus subsp. oscitans DS 12.976]|uniref:Uncharacterized protein n=1 Tax=Streptomyces roseochromogenus subsp. oscitans DS 12.976 TaxID=1352936 RepID=V6JI61_STRRC|nr:hypothetical protein M878_43695 [Streptomyces roseochromogenus subsp. oscitans DS 12.976]
MQMIATVITTWIGSSLTKALTAGARMPEE